MAEVTDLPGTPWERIGDRAVMTVESYVTGATLVLSVAPDGAVSQHEAWRM